MSKPKRTTRGKKKATAPQAKQFGFPGELAKAYDEALAKFGALRHVTGIDIGTRYRRNRFVEDDDQVIRIHVREKLPLESLNATDIFPKEIRGVPVDVIQASYTVKTAVRPSPPRGQVFAQLQPGISCGAVGLGSGTLGAMVYDLADGRPGILSNWHVLSGFLAQPPSGWAPIIQPGTSDYGKAPQHTVAHLRKHILDRRGDAAFAALVDGRQFVPYQFGSGAWVNSSRAVRKGETLIKSGRTTAVTAGRVEGVGTYRIYYPSIGQECQIDGFKLVHPLPLNIRNEEISDEGDSGSIWYDPSTGAGVGLLMAGERPDQTGPQQEHSIACHFEWVLNALQLSLTPP